MGRKFKVALFCIVFFLSFMFLLTGCNHENREDGDVVEPTIEEKIEGTWFAGREPLELPSSYLMLTSSGKVYLSTDGVRYSTLSGSEYMYRYNVYSGNYYISGDDYLFLELTHYCFGVETYESAFEVFNATLESYHGGEIKSVILEIKNNSLITVEEQPLKYSKTGD